MVVSLSILNRFSHLSIKGMCNIWIKQWKNLLFLSLFQTTLLILQTKLFLRSSHFRGASIVLMTEFFILIALGTFAKNANPDPYLLSNQFEFYSLNPLARIVMHPIVHF